jgi:hypothetical protein
LWTDVKFWKHQFPSKVKGPGSTYRGNSQFSYQPTQSNNNSNMSDSLTQSASDIPAMVTTCKNVDGEAAIVAEAESSHPQQEDTW